MSPYVLTLIGGDLRMAWLAQLLTNDGHIVKLYGQEENDFPFDGSVIHCCDLETALCTSDACILGIPCSRDKKTVYAPFSQKTIPISDIISLLSDDQYLFGGMLPCCHDNAIDYALDESFIWANTLPTAEGALQLLMQHSPHVVSGSRIAILGYGRVAQKTAHLLHTVGAHVTVYARDPLARTKADIFGLNSKDLPHISEDIASYHAVLNTIPAVILTKDILEKANKNTLFMELASAPGGFDQNAIRQLELSYIAAGGLPGKVAPQTAAQYIKNTILNRLEELP